MFILSIFVYEVVKFKIFFSEVCYSFVMKYVIGFYFVFRKWSVDVWVIKISVFVF